MASIRPLVFHALVASLLLSHVDSFPRSEDTWDEIEDTSAGDLLLQNRVGGTSGCPPMDIQEARKTTLTLSGFGQTPWNRLPMDGQYKYCGIEKSEKDWARPIDNFKLEFPIYCNAKKNGVAKIRVSYNAGSTPPGKNERAAFWYVEEEPKGKLKTMTGGGAYNKIAKSGSLPKEGPIVNPSGWKQVADHGTWEQGYEINSAHTFGVDNPGAHVAC